MVGLLFLSYPLAAIPLKMIPFMHQWGLPATTLLTILAVPVILGSRWRPRTMPAILIGLYLASIVVATVTRGHSLDALPLAGYLLVPWAVALIYRDGQLFRISWLGPLMMLLWASQVGSGLLALAQGREPIGFSGNRNWLAIVLLTTAVWSLIWLLQIGKRHLQGWLRLALPALAILPLTLFIVYHCASRGAWLALLTIGLFLVWCKLRRLERSLFIVFCTLLVITLTVLFPRQVIRQIQHDVRLPIIGRTVAMTIDHDVTAATLWTVAKMDTSHWERFQGVAGVGPGQFRQQFAPYRARSTYGERGTAAAITIHPHNEFLNLAAQIGLLGALAWLVLFQPVLQRPDWQNPLRTSAQLTVILIGVHAMFDMPWVQPPSSILVLLSLGICWRDLFRPAGTCLPVWRPLLFTAQAAALLAVCSLTWWDWRHDQTYRQALIAEHTKRPEQAIELYRRMSMIDEHNLLGLYSAGRLAFEQLQDPALTVELLSEVVATDPNYAHVNGLLGTALLALGQGSEALRHLARECQLYPHEPAALQKYINALILTNQPQRLPALIERLDSMYLLHAERRHRPEQLERLLNDWYEQVENRQPEAAIQTATELCAGSPIAFTDPLFHQLTAETPWPRSLLQDGFNYADYAFWQQVLLADRLLAKAPGQPESDEQLRWLTERVWNQLTIDPQDTRFRFLDQAWSKGKGSPATIYTAYAFLVRQAGFWPMLLMDDQGQPIACLVQSGDRLWRIDLEAKTMSAAAPPSGARLQAFFYLQEFFLKNRVLGVVSGQHLSRLGAAFDKMPVTVLWYRTRLDDTRFLSFTALPAFCYDGQIKHVTARMKKEPHLP